MLLAFWDETGVESINMDWWANYWKQIRDVDHLPHPYPMTCDACVREDFLKKADELITKMGIDNETKTA